MGVNWFSRKRQSGVRRDQVAAPSVGPVFRSGQLWHFTGPADQPDAELVIVQVDEGDAPEPVVHVAILKVWFDGSQTTVTHLPFAESALARSVTQLVAESVPVPEPAETLCKDWRAEFDAGRAGAFTLTVGEAVDAVLQIARDGEPST